MALTVSVVKQKYIFLCEKLNTGISWFLLNNFILFQSTEYHFQYDIPAKL